MAAAMYLRIVMNDDPPYSRILIIVDSDCDGFTSAAIMYQYTKRVNCHCQVDYWLHEGKQHGLQDHIEKLMNENVQYDLIISMRISTKNIIKSLFSIHLHFFGKTL